MNKRYILISILLGLSVIILTSKIYIDLKVEDKNSNIKNSNKASISIKDKKENSLSNKSNEVASKIELDSSDDTSYKKEINNNITIASSNTSKNTKDETIIKYFNDTNTYVDNNLTNSNISSKIGDKVATMIGFIWYGEKINGITYNELTSETKEKVNNIFSKIDSKIESKVPSYKEKIKGKYNAISLYLKDKYTNTKENIQNYIENKVDKDKLDKTKDTYNEVKEEVKIGLQEGKNEIKEVKDVYKEKINEWYQKKKSN